MGLDQGSFTQRLGVGVGVGPAQRRSSGPAGLDQPVADPAGSQLLGLGGQGRGAGRAQLGPGRLAEPGQLLGRAAPGLGVATRPPCALDLGAPAHVHEERALVHHLLEGGTAPVAGHVAGGHRHQVRGNAQIVERGRDAHGAEQVDLDRGVEGRVERHRGRRVDDDVATGQDGPAGLVETQAVTADVTGHRRQALGDEVVEGGGPPTGLSRAGVLGPQAVEGVVLDDLARHPLLHRGALAGSDQQHDLAVGHLAHNRSTSAVPRKPVAPVTNRRLPARVSAIIPLF